MLKTPEAIVRYQAARILPVANPLTSEAFKKKVQEEQRQWKAVVTREKIVLD